MSSPDSPPLPPVIDPRCGTYAGVQVHWRHGEGLCDNCKPAQRTYIAESRRRGRCAPGLGWPLGPYDPAPRGPIKRLPPKWAR